MIEQEEEMTRLT